MKLRLLVPFVLVVQSVAIADVPHSIVGTWHMNMARVMCEEDHPENKNCPLATSKRCVAQSPSDPHKLVFTDTTISQSGTTVPYRVLGGNSALVILESSDATGETFVSHVRLIEGGLAVQTLDCQRYRKMCERGHEQARVELSKRAEKKEGLPEQNKSLASDKQRIDGLVPPDFNAPPIWIYFRSAHAPAYVE